MASSIKMSVAKTLVFYQDTASDTWTIVYASASMPIVEVLVNNASTGKLEKMLPKSISTPVAGTVEIKFSTPFAGIARVVY